MKILEIMGMAKEDDLNSGLARVFPDSRSVAHFEGSHCSGSGYFCQGQGGEEWNSSCGETGEEEGNSGNDFFGDTPASDQADAEDDSEVQSYHEAQNETIRGSRSSGRWR